MNYEYERKFLIKFLPKNLEKYSICNIKQWYISHPDDEISKRIRLYDDGRCYYDEKMGNGIIRIEKGRKCDFSEFQNIVHKYPYINKKRYKLYCNDYIILIDIFEHGLLLVEIESKNLLIIKDFIPLIWFGDEVTDNKKYSNNYIAYHKSLI
jgi:CYTH domain-containing protein